MRPPTEAAVWSWAWFKCLYPIPQWWPLTHSVAFENSPLVFSKCHLTRPRCERLVLHAIYLCAYYFCMSYNLNTTQHCVYVDIYLHLNSEDSCYCDSTQALHFGDFQPPTLTHMVVVGLVDALWLWMLFIPFDFTIATLCLCVILHLMSEH